MTSATPAVRQHVHRHLVNVAHLEDASLGARIADRVVAFIGSWGFILILELQKKTLERMPDG